MLNSLRFKINAAILVTCGIIVVIFWSLLYPFEMSRRNARFEEIHVLLDTVFQQKRDELANEIFAGQHLALARTLEDMQRVKGIAILSVYDLKGNRVLSTDESLPHHLGLEQRQAIDRDDFFEIRDMKGGSFVAYATLIQVIGEKIGYLYMYYDLADMERESTTTLVFFVGLLLSTLTIMTLLLNVFLSRSVIRPASVLRDAIRKVQEGRLGEQVDLPVSDEIGEMASDFNDMSRRLQEQHVALTDAIAAKDAYAARLEESNRELETLNTRLEDMVEARTAELRSSNEQLQLEINERRQAEKEKIDLEERLARSQKMEALGLLAGGVAHDLNNVLSGIVSCPDLLLLELGEESPLRKPVLTIQDSGQKAAAIVQDLLTLARRGVTSTEVLNLNEVIGTYLLSPEYAKLSNYHPDVRIETRLSDDLLNIQGSPVHLRALFSHHPEVCGRAQGPSSAGGLLRRALSHQFSPALRVLRADGRHLFPDRLRRLGTQKAGPVRGTRPSGPGPLGTHPEGKGDSRDRGPRPHGSRRGLGAPRPAGHGVADEGLEHPRPAAGASLGARLPGAHQGQDPFDPEHDEKPRIRRISRFPRMGAAPQALEQFGILLLAHPGEEEADPPVSLAVLTEQEGCVGVGPKIVVGQAVGHDKGHLVTGEHVGTGEDRGIHASLGVGRSENPHSFGPLEVALEIGFLFQGVNLPFI